MQILKREGFTEPFEFSKIRTAVNKAFTEARGGDNNKNVDFITEEVVEKIQGCEDLEIFKDEAEVDVELIQDTIEDTLIENSFKDVAKAFIRYRQTRSDIRNKGWEMDDLQQSIWSKKYQVKDESFEQWLDRVSGGNPRVSKLIRQKKFIFAGRILAHRGQVDKNVTYSNCYVMTPPEDNIESIFETAKELARTYSYGGGCGVDISKLRPRGMAVNNSAKETSGATSFMQLYDLTTGIIGQNGRRGALMMSIEDTHPDLEEFMDIKTKEGSVTKANISIRITDAFMKAVEDNKQWVMSWQGETNSIEKMTSARRLFHKNAVNNWDWAEAGVLFWDRIRLWHLQSHHPEHEFAGVNPCAEEPLMEDGSCLLGSLNLSEFVAHPFTDKAYFDTDSFVDAVMVSVGGLNEVLDEGLPLHPLQGQRDNARDWRQIGLGIMGLSEMFIKLGIEYGSERSMNMSKKIGHILLNSSILASSHLAEEHGVFPKYDEEALFKSDYFQANVSPFVKDVVKKFGIRNSQILTIAPTGSISTMWGVSGGIEPMFATHFDRKTESLHGEDVTYRVYQPIVQEWTEVQRLTAHPQNLLNPPKNLFVTSQTVNWRDRIKLQGVWQHFIDASISSTVNLPKETTVEEVEELFMTAWKHGLKGVTIFRDGCKRLGILTLVSDDPEQPVTAEAVETGEEGMVCSECGETIEVFSGGCSVCMNCGHSPC